MKYSMTKPTGLLLTAILAVILVGCGQQPGNTAAGSSSHTELKGNGVHNGVNTEPSKTVQDGITVTKASPTNYVATPYDVHIVGKSSKKVVHWRAGDDSHETPVIKGKYSFYMPRGQGDYNVDISETPSFQGDSTKSVTIPKLVPFGSYEQLNNQGIYDNHEAIAKMYGKLTGDSSNPMEGQPEDATNENFERDLTSDREMVHWAGSEGAWADWPFDDHKFSDREIVLDCYEAVYSLGGSPNQFYRNYKKFSAEIKSAPNKRRIATMTVNHVQFIFRYTPKNDPTVKGEDGKSLLEQGRILGFTMYDPSKDTGFKELL